MTQQEYVERNDLKVDAIFAAFIEDKALDGTGVSPDSFWTGLSDLAHDFGARNRALLDTRAELQTQLDLWHRVHKDGAHRPKPYKAFLEEIGYLLPEGDAFSIETTQVDPEIAAIAGPQLVVPITNARFVLNAANARWGSLYDAYYGTDAMGEAPVAGPYDQGRGARVVSRATV